MLLYSIVALQFLLIFLLLRKLRSTAYQSKNAPNPEDAQMREQVLMFTQIFDAISEMVLVKDSQSRIIWANQAFREFYGMTHEELSGIIDSEFSKPQHTEQYLKDDRYVFETGKSLDIPKEPVTRPDGTSVHFHTVKSAIRNDRGQVTMTVGVSRDISERLRHEELIAEQQQKMIHSAKLSVIGEMSGGIAHEINNPVSIIYGKAKMLQRLGSTDELDAQSVVKEARRIEEMATRIATIVRSLRMIARDGERDPFEKVQIARIIEDTVSLCRERFHHYNIDFVVKNADENLQLECRAVQISQVLLNLLTNACDAVENRDGKRIELDISSDGRIIEFRVKDNGVGIDSSLQEKVFHPFFTTKELGKGTGIGLSLARGIAEAHRGTLTLENCGALTCFLLKIPLKQSAVS